MRRLVLPLLTLLAVVGCTNYGTELTFKKGHLYYKAPVTESEARKVGEWLEQNGYYDDTTQRDVQLLKEGDGFVLKFVVQKDKLNDAAELSFRAMREFISQQALGGAKVAVQLADENLESFKTL